jgi:hypothetical protein
MQTIAVDFTQQTDLTPVTIGVATEGAPNQTWFKIDNFRLYRLTDGITVGLDAATTATAHRDGTAIYDLTGRRVATTRAAAPGVYIVGGKKLVRK